MVRIRASIGLFPWFDEMPDASSPLSNDEMLDVLFGRFTGRARKIISHATAERRRLNALSVDTVALLLGALLEPEGIAAVVLNSHNLTSDYLVAQYQFVRQAPEVPIALVADTAQREAKWLRHNYPGTEHLLLGICCLHECRASRLIAWRGLHAIELCHAVLVILGREYEWDRWLNAHRLAVQ
jgi:ATP-dependent Clp protease ATP-binding subunit ClpC